MGFGSDRERGNNELEEGEACSYNGINNNNINGHSCDPDVALAYIGDKLQNVLGHFQKDFEGGVSAEYLGTKFGGYGSFLSDRQQSPLWSQSRSPSEQNYAASKSPNNFQAKVGRHNSKVSLSGHPSGGNGSVNSGAKLPDQRGIKVKIKMNSDNLKPKKNAAVYSGLGLDVSPTSSLGDSLSECEAVSGELQYSQQKSPNSILRVMTSFPLHGDIILSPLPEDILHLTEEKRPVSRNMLASSGGLDPVKNERKVVREKTVKQPQNDNFSGESKVYRNTKSARTVVPKNEVDIDTLACEELVSKTLKLPLLSDSDARKGTAETSNTLRESHKPVGSNQLRHTVKEDVLKPEVSKDKGWAEKVKPELSGSTQQDKKEISLENHTIRPNKDNHNKVGKTYKSVKGQEMVQMDFTKQMGIQKVASDTHEGTNHPLKKISKKKSKGCKTHGSLSGEPTKRVSRADTSSLLRSRGTPSDSYRSRSESEDLKMSKDLPHSRDRYREFFGDINFEDEEEDHPPASPEFPPVDSHKNFEVAVKSSDAVANTVEGTISSKKALTSGVQWRRDSDVAPHSAKLPSFDSHSAPVAPMVVEDLWVQCDKCQKWRLLPSGRNPKSLPEKWLCAMLDWLPGMNKCTISEEDTTKALYALYQVPVPERQNYVHGNTAQVFTSADIHHFSPKLQNSNLPEPNVGKKKHKLKEVPDAMKGEDRARFSEPLMKHKKISSVKGRHTHDVKKSPLVSMCRIQQVSKASEFNVEKQQPRQTTIHKSDGCFSGGGDTKKSKMKRKKEHNQDHPRPSKKIFRVEYTKSFEEGWTPNNDANGKNGTSFRDKDDSDDAQVPLRKSKNKFQGFLTDGSPRLENHGSREGLMKNKKGNGYATTLSGTGHNVQDTTVSMDGLSDNNECRNRKKRRLCNSEGRESSTGEGNGRPDKRGGHTKNKSSVQDKKNTSYRKMLDRTNREIGLIQPCMTATSSSSKVSGSQKSRTNIQEVKGSPVESVSSLPRRIVNQDKGLVTRTGKVKDDCKENGYRRIGSPCNPVGEEGGSDQLGDVRTEKHFALPSHGIIEPPVLDCQDWDFDIPSSNGPTRQTVHSTDIKQPYTNDKLDEQGHANQQSNKMRASDHGQDGGGQNDYRYLAKDSSKRKSSKVRPKDKILSAKSGVDVSGKEISKSHAELQSGTPSHKLKPSVRVQEMLENSKQELENKYVGKKESSIRQSYDNSKGQNKYHSGSGFSDCPEVKQDAVCSGERLSTPSKSLMLNNEGGRYNRRSSFEKTDRDEPVSGKGQSSLPTAGVGQDEALTCETEPVLDYQKGIQAEKLASGALKDESVPKLPKKVGKAADHFQGQNINSRHSTENGKNARDLEAPSPCKRESSSQAATRTLKEAKDLKHLADKLKNSGANNESTGLYFQAVLKFLHAASLIESSYSENARHNEMIQSMQVYSSTAKLCEFCAHEFEKAKDMPSAALAYKCMEVAYMRVVYSSRMSVNRERQELLTALQMVAPGESPSSSISDVDNMNNLTSVDKATLAKGLGSPLVNGNNIIAGQNRTNFVRLLNFTRDVSFAMEASRKCRNAFAAANVTLSGGRLKEGIYPVKRALDFNFHDVEGFLRLVRLAMEAISR